jgi:SAM-dependent methyltransferase
MGSPYLSPYEDPAVHRRVSELIRKHSSNPEDVRRATLDKLDLAGATDVLDLGCGFGFWAQELAGRVAPGALFTGMDACDRDEAPYRSCIEAAGRRARFICTNLVSHLPFDDDSFDLVIAAYSLYFFVHILPEAARVLRPGGRLLAVTHSESSFVNLLETLGFAPASSPLIRRIREFSAENGEEQLSRSFERVERVDYLNSLHFSDSEHDDYLEYLHFKLPLLQPGAHYESGLTPELMERAGEALSKAGRIHVRKDDVLFHCGGPHVP